MSIVINSLRQKTTKVVLMLKLVEFSNIGYPKVNPYRIRFNSIKFQNKDEE